MLPLILHWALLLTTCPWSLWLHVTCGSTGFITGTKSIRLKLFFSLFLNFAICPVFSSHLDILENEEGNRSPSGGIAFAFPGVRVPPQEHHPWGVSAFLPLPPLVHKPLSYPLFPCPQCALLFAVKMVSYLLHRGIVSLS